MPTTLHSGVPAPWGALLPHTLYSKKEVSVGVSACAPLEWTPQMHAMGIAYGQCAVVSSKKLRTKNIIEVRAGQPIDDCRPAGREQDELPALTQPVGSARVAICVSCTTTV